MRKLLYVLEAASAISAAVVSCGAAGQPDGVKTIDLDGLRVTWIRDNAEPRLMERSLFQDASDSLLASLGLNDGVPASVSVFLVEKEGRYLLFDTGLGMPGSGLLPSLHSLGLAPEDIDCIFLTHFHGDHIGGMIGEGGEAVFPDADVYVPEVEYDEWMAMPVEKKGQVVAVMDCYEDRLHKFGYADDLPYGVKPIAAPGHTPGHTLYQIGRLLVVGDLVHGAALQLVHPEICALYDMDPNQAAATRVSILDYARQGKFVMGGMHFPEPAFIFPEQ